MSEWFNRRGTLYWYDQYANNEHPLAFSRYDPDRIAAELVATGAEVIVLYATNQWGVAYYPSAHWPEHPGLAGRDYVGDLVDRLRKHSKRIVLYVNWLDSKHPEWRCRWSWQQGQAEPELPLANWADPSRPNGAVRNLPGGQWIFPCVNSPYGRQVLNVAEELLQRYRPDGFSLDMFLFGDLCLCEYCQPTLREICAPDPVSREAILKRWPAYIDWRCRTTAAFLDELSAVSRRHGAIAAHNAFAPPFQPSSHGNDEPWLPALDVFVSECFDAFLAPHTDLNSTSLLVRWHRAVGKPSWILRTSTSAQYAHWPISKAQWELYAAACKANGCKVFGPCGVGARPDTTSPPSLLENVKHGLDFYMQDADLDEGAESLAKVALVYSWRTRRYCPPDPGIGRWSAELAGWGRFLIEEHLPFDMLVAENVRSGQELSRYDLVVLPHLTHLGEAFCEALEQYVRDGGRVLATGETSLFDDRGRPRDDLALGKVLGVSRQGAVEGCFAIEYEGDAAPAYGVFQQVRGAGEVLCRRWEVDPAGSVAAMKDPLPVEVSPWPVGCVNAFGRGRAGYVAFEIGGFFDAHGDEHVAELMRRMTDRLLPARQLDVRAPRTVEVTLFGRSEPPRVIIHLANRTVPWTLPTNQRQITEVVPVSDLEVELPAPWPKVKVSARRAEVACQRRGERLRLRLPRLGVYAAVILEPAD